MLGVEQTYAETCELVPLFTDKLNVFWKVVRFPKARRKAIFREPVHVKQ